ncbi:unnamed protein product [Kuraishia capsulata CBS 1993]|uniref:CAP-Gly domain-containing protein n=1 Tax=Kuraishia capsulata CBS 1993 TaxID=1382522 RepID=W6MF88_9ASCO|nr:uncharacterized protein KUCA_T00000081001 [Kuraishia capsulata CBS 1993]CDK24121.1 unnamed protein product [Kuraishia capsulata CBS 1993]
MELSIGTTVDLPGGGLGVLRFKGQVEGKTGLFAGVELVGDSVSMGRNSGDFKGRKYFNTRVPNSGLFLPYKKLQLSQMENKSPYTGEIIESETPVRAPRANTTPALATPPMVTSLPNRSPLSFAPINKPPQPRGGKFPIITLKSPVEIHPIKGDVENTGSQRRPSAPRTGSSEDHSSHPGSPKERKFESQIQVLQVQLKKSQDERNSLSSKVERFSKELDERNRILKNLQSTIHDHLEPALAEMEKELANKDSKMVRLKKNAEAQRQEFMEVIESLERQAAESAEMYEAELMKYQNDSQTMSSLEKRVEELGKMLNNNESAKANLVQQIAQLTKTLQEKDAKMKDMTAEIAKQHELTNDLTKRHEEDKKELARLTKLSEDASKSQPRNFEDELQINEKTIKQLTQKNRDLQDKLKQLESHQTELNKARAKSPQMYTKDAMDLVRHQRDSIEREKNEEIRNLQARIASLETGSLVSKVPSLTNSSSSINSPASSPVLGRVSQVVDGQLRVYIPPEPVDASAGRNKWCGLCERTGHESIDCPYENDMF